MNSLQIFCFLLLFKSLQAGIQVSFGERDMRCSEDDGVIRVLVTSTGNIAEGDVVTLEVTPTTPEQYLAENNSLPYGLSLDEDPAEPGLDFNSSSHLVTFDHEHTRVVLNVSITRDRISENDEVFLLHMKDVTEPAEGKDKVQVTLERAVTVAHIVQPSSNKVLIGFSEEMIVVDESSGRLDNLFIELSGKIEPTALVKIFRPSSIDMVVPSNLNIALSDGHRVPVPVEIMDDLIAENEEECVRLILIQESDYASLYSVNPKQRMVEICIRDNDTPRLGFEIMPSGNGTGDSMEIMEGETKQVCVVLVEPEGCELFMRVDVRLSENSPDTNGLIDFELPQPFFLQNEHNCFEVTAYDNLDINHPPQFQFELSTEVFVGHTLQSGEDYVLTDPGLLVIRDNDGVPVLPTEVVLQYLEKSSVLISWQYDGSDLQPADKFTITVQTTSTQQHVGLSRRQAGNVQVPSLSPNDVWEYETEKTSLVVELTDNSKRYVITVCAVNEFGSECTEPQELKEYTGEPQQPEKQIGDPRDVNTNSLQVEAAGLEQQDVLVVEGKPSRGLVIAIAVVAPVMALVLCMALICAIVICRCYGRSKEYYPARQGIIQEKIVLGSIDLIQPKYFKQSSSTTSVSMEWTSVEVCDPKPVKEKQFSHILGTPV